MPGGPSALFELVSEISGIQYRIRMPTVPYRRYGPSRSPYGTVTVPYRYDTGSSVSKYIQLSSDPNKAYFQTLLLEASGTQLSLSARANCFSAMVKKYADAERTQAPADSANTAVKAAQGPSLFAMVVALQDSPADLQVTKEMAQGRVGGGHKLGINYMDFIKIKGA
ncbi:hypothetical protein GGX14DRAFT_595261 [Mycena pura]|uniref:Uncharacterized protein n=1 Tax=Mycena pura TaxID=153505 RepID=A0AAD6VW04_9AGAR|nr:hypothetical protein GGX14DRAFT_595261 [Mycena pura]